MPRDETDEEKADRKFADILQELRVMQTGVQLTAGFLLTLPFQERFADLDDVQRTTYLVLVVLAGVTTAVVLTPVAVHRRLSGQHVKARVVEAAHRMARTALACVALLVVGVIWFIFDLVVYRGAAVGVAAVMAVLALLLLVAYPLRVHADALGEPAAGALAALVALVAARRVQRRRWSRPVDGGVVGDVRDVGRRP